MLFSSSSSKISVILLNSDIQHFCGKVNYQSCCFEGECIFFYYSKDISLCILFLSVWIYCLDVIPWLILLGVYSTSWLTGNFWPVFFQINCFCFPLSLLLELQLYGVVILTIYCIFLTLILYFQFFSYLCDMFLDLYIFY